MQHIPKNKLHANMMNEVLRLVSQTEQQLTQLCSAPVRLVLWFDHEVPGTDNTTRLGEWIRALVCSEFGVRWEDVQGTGKRRALTDARGTYTWLATRYIKSSAQQIGRELHRDRTTICVTLKRVKDLLSVGDDIQERIQRIEKQIASRQYHD
jgi:chromosomal replication initiation ATPase DnaA